MTKTFKYLSAVLLMLASVIGVRAQRLVDNDTRLPLPLASVMDREGNLVGMTDHEGAIPPVSADCYPLTFSSLGYKPLEIGSPVTADIGMSATAYDLPEVIISPRSRPLLYLTGYVREVSSLFGSSDSVTIFRESIVDFMLPVGETRVKGWKKPRELTSKTYVRMTNAEGLDSVSNHTDYDYLLWTGTFGVIPSSVNVPAGFGKGISFASDTVMGKYTPKFVWQKSNGTFRCRKDGLADRKGHVYTPWQLKAMGLTTDLNELSQNYVFETTGGDQPTLADISSFSLSISLLIKSKLLKSLYKSSKPVCQKSYVEVYITGREYLTDEEAKKRKKSRYPSKRPEWRHPGMSRHSIPV